MSVLGRDQYRQYMPQRGEIVQRHVFGRAHLEVFSQLAKKLGLLDAVNSEVGLEIGVQVNDLGGITGLLDDKINQKRFKLRCVETRGRGTGSRIWRSG